MDSVLFRYCWFDPLHRQVDAVQVMLSVFEKLS